MIATPPREVYPPGHATHAFISAEVLRALIGHSGDARSKEYIDRAAGLHYPVDSAAAAVLGRQIGRLLPARVRASRPDDLRLASRGDLTARTLSDDTFLAPDEGCDARSLPGRDFHGGTMAHLRDERPEGEAPPPDAEARLAAALWRAARVEWEPEP